MLLTVLFAEFDKISFKHPHHDGGQEASQEQHRDAAVDDGEPVDLGER
jgi:hypothetical protein